MTAHNASIAKLRAVIDRPYSSADGVVTSRARMRLPIIPILVAATLLGAVWYLFTATRPDRRTLTAPHLTRLADIEGTETEVAFTPDGESLAVVSSGDLWVLKLSSGEKKQLTHTPEP